MQIRRLFLALLCALTPFSMGVANADVFYSNATTDLNVRGGLAANGLIPPDGYFSYTDKVVIPAEETTWSIDPVLIAPTGNVFVLSNSLLSAPVDVAGKAQSTATVDGGLVDVVAETELVDRVARTTLRFTSLSGSQSLAGYKVLFYAENDLFSPNDDAATYTGSIAGANLKLFQYDTITSDFYVQVNESAVPTNATLATFGAGIWTGWGTSLEAADLSVLSADGSNFATLGDLGLALQWDLGDAASSLITVDYGVTTDVPEPATGAAIALLMTSLIRRRTRR